eukprot:COSAG06_NODE_66641_length_254_cov_0.445161_1_plen_62_part_01
MFVCCFSPVVCRGVGWVVWSGLGAEAPSWGGAGGGGEGGGGGGGGGGEGGGVAWTAVGSRVS